METLETLHNTSSSSSLTMNQSAAGAGVAGLGGSHCWEEDGSIHSVCIFVLSVSGVCTIATMLTVYRVIQMILAAVRYGSYNISQLRSRNIPFSSQKVSHYLRYMSYCTMHSIDLCLHSKLWLHSIV